MQQSERASNIVIPIAQTIVNWKTLTAITSSVLERNLISPLDRHNIKVEGLAAFVSVLGEFQEKDLDPIRTQREPGNLLRHAMISFLVSASKDALFDIAINGPVSILDCEIQTFVIMSGSLQEWRTLILNLCSERTTQSGRDLGTQILLTFDGLGLSKIFEAYSRRTHNGALILLPKS